MDENKGKAEAEVQETARNRWTDHLTFWGLVLSYPVLALLCLLTKCLESTIPFYAIPNTYCVIALVLAFDASLRIRRRTRVVTRTRSQVANSIVDIIPILLVVAMAQIFNRDVLSIVVDKEFIAKFHYQPSSSVVHVMGWMGSFWAVLIAYAVKYHWDALITAYENASDNVTEAS